MNDTIKQFEPFYQEFNPVKLFNSINKFDNEKLIKLNKYIIGDPVQQHDKQTESELSREELLFYPVQYLTELCYEEYEEGMSFVDINYSDIWEERFEFTDLIERFKNDR